MPTPLVILLCALWCLIGYHLPFQGRRVKNPRRVPGADAEYTVAWIANEPHAFTDEQLTVARQRAQRLKLE